MSALPVNLLIPGAPVTKKNHPRILRNRRTGKPFVMPAAALVIWTNDAVLQLQSQWRGRPPLNEPLGLTARIFRARNHGDLNNYLAAIGDALQTARIITNDRQIGSHGESRLLLDPKNPRVEITLFALPPL